MTENALNNDRIPTDPIQFAGLLLLVAVVIGHLSPDQRDTLSQVFGLAGTIAPFLPRGGR